MNLLYKTSVLGIPDKSNKGNINNLNAGDIAKLIIQEHTADRAGKHFDLRIGNKETGLLSWATRKELPRPGERIGIFQQPVHSYDYKDFEGIIPSGYGKGSVRKHTDGTVLITKVTDNTLHFTRADQRYPERFVMVKPQSFENDNWLLINVTPTKPVDYVKLKYTAVAPKDIEQAIDKLPEGSSAQPKLDGAAVLTQLLHNKPEILSYRISKETNRPIVHTERFFGGRPEIELPKEYRDSLLRGELYGVKNDKALPPQELGGLLNSSIGRSLKTQKDQKIDLKTMIFDVEKLKNKDVRKMPYGERLSIAKKIVSYFPSDKFTIPEEAKSRNAIKELIDTISKGNHPLTREGIVIHKPHGKPIKTKLREEFDVYITGVFPGEGKYENAGGGFTYSLSSDGPTVGKVGTGFSDVLRTDIAKNPGSYIGRVARVISQEKLSSGALRAPALIAIHEDYPTKAKRK